jgi:hypothetical protein
MVADVWTGGRSDSPWGVTADRAGHRAGASATDADVSVAVDPARESAPCETAFGDGLVVLGAPTVRYGSPLPRVVRGVGAVVEPASPASASARTVSGSTGASDSGGTSGRVAVRGFKGSCAVTTVGSSLISRPDLRHLSNRLLPQRSARTALIIGETTDRLSPARYRPIQMPRQPLSFVAPGELPHAVERGLLSRIV